MRLIERGKLNNSFQPPLKLREGIEGEGFIREEASGFRVKPGMTKRKIKQCINEII